MFSVQRLPVVSFIITDRCDARAPRDLSLLKGEEVKVKDYGTHVDAVVIIICAPQTFLSRARIREFVLAQKINKRLREMMMPSLYFFLSTKFKASARIELIEDGAYFFSHPVHDTNRCRRVRPLYTRQMVWDAFINCIASQCAHSCIQRNVRMDGSSLRSCVENTSWRSSGGDTHFPIYTIHKYIRERKTKLQRWWRSFRMASFLHSTALSSKSYPAHSTLDEALLIPPWNRLHNKPRFLFSLYGNVSQQYRNSLSVRFADACFQMLGERSMKRTASNAEGAFPLYTFNKSRAKD